MYLNGNANLTSGKWGKQVWNVRILLLWTLLSLQGVSKWAVYGLLMSIWRAVGLVVACRSLMGKQHRIMFHYLNQILVASRQFNPWMEAPPKGWKCICIPTSLTSHIITSLHLSNTDFWKLAIAKRRNWTELPYGVDEEKKPHCPRGRRQLCDTKNLKQLVPTRAPQEKQWTNLAFNTGEV